MRTIKKFWNWIKNEEGRTLYFDGYIAQDSWFDDDITPKKFKSELMESDGDISVWINSPGGDVFAASQIYNMLKEYKEEVKDGKKHYIYTSKNQQLKPSREPRTTEKEDGSLLQSLNRPNRTVIKL